MKEIFDCIIKDSESHLSYLAFISRRNRVVKCDLVHIMYSHWLKRMLPAANVEQFSRSVKSCLKGNFKMQRVI